MGTELVHARTLRARWGTGRVQTAKGSVQPAPSSVPTRTLGARARTSSVNARTGSVQGALASRKGRNLMGHRLPGADAPGRNSYGAQIQEAPPIGWHLSRDRVGYAAPLGPPPLPGATDGHLATARG